MGTPNSFMEGDGSVIVWFRQDLRIHDNEALTEAISTGKPVIPVYVFDSRNYKDSRFDGFPKTGPIRMKFIIESVIDLRRNLHKIGLPLVVRTGFSEEIIFELGRNNKAHYIFCNRERTKDQVIIQDAVEQNLWRGGMELRYSRGKMLYYTADLPFPVTHTPDNFLVFRKEVENMVKIRKPIPSPEKQMNNLRQILDEGNIPALEQLGFRQNDLIMEHTEIEGGETMARETLKLYMGTSASQPGSEMPADYFGESREFHSFLIRVHRT
jgi:deoxyribodipyrimidine photo-lyase